jgi:SAM-dependent methyltransferase
MSAPDKSSAEFFEERYRDKGDPWDLANDSYEQARYDTIIRALAGKRYSYAYEPGCAVGALTVKLATICDRVDACDFSQTAVGQARQRCIDFPGVAVRCASMTDVAPIEKYDLLVLSEIGYYLTLTAWESLVLGIVDRMQPGAILLASHWLGRSPDHILTGDEVHACMQHPKLKHEHAERHPDSKDSGFRLDRWTRIP